MRLGGAWRLQWGVGREASPVPQPALDPSTLSTKEEENEFRKKKMQSLKLKTS